MPQDYIAVSCLVKIIAKDLRAQINKDVRELTKGLIFQWRYGYEKGHEFSDRHI